MSKAATLYLGANARIDRTGGLAPFELPAHHMVTHAVTFGQTGSGKTGLTLVMVEEALQAGVPVLMVDVKGDLPNLLLCDPTFSSAAILPWIESTHSPSDPRSPQQVAVELAAQRKHGLAQWSICEPELARYVQRIAPRVITPGSSAGELLHVLSSLERRSDRWDQDLESARAALSAAVSLLLRLLGRDPDPAKSKEHVLLSILAERRLLVGQNADIAALLSDLDKPPISEVGAQQVDVFLPKNERRALATALNTLLASPSFASWRQGATLDIQAWLTPQADARTPAVIVSVAHLDDDERALVLGVLLEEVLSWVRTLPGSQRLRALIVFDEVYGFLPPHPQSPPTKRPLVSLMKQARAFGVGVLVATQNPMDLDYRALSNAGLWCIGRLQTDADRARVVEGLAGAGGIGGGHSAAELAAVIKSLEPRWFLVRNAHDREGVKLVMPRYAMSFMKGPMTRGEIRRALWVGR
jgi:hypothetical protein